MIGIKYMKKLNRCYVCPIILNSECKGTLFTYVYCPGLMSEDEVRIEAYLCPDCTDWASRVPEALNAIIEGRERRKRQ